VIRRREHRTLAGLVAALWILFPCFADLHGKRERHRYCVQHGAFEDVDDAGGAGSPNDASSRLAPAPARGPAHHPCAFVQAAPARVAGALTAGLGELAPRLTEATRLPRSPGRRPIPLLLVAPKSSPPAAV
jgi:hypothetical protein